MDKQLPPASAIKFNDLSRNTEERHEFLLDVFGKWIFWHRNQTLRASQKLVESEEDRKKIGAIRRKPYEGIAAMPPAQREAALLFAKETLDGILERLLWSLGDEGIDCLFDDTHAYRFRINIEIVDLQSREIVEEQPVNRNGCFFGSNWGRWLNRHKDV